MSNKTNEGEILALWLSSRRWSAIDLARELGVKKQTVYHHLAKIEIADAFKKRLREKKFDVFDIPLSSAIVSTKTNIVSESDEEIYQSAFKETKNDKTYMDRLMKSYEDQIELLKDGIRQRDEIISLLKSKKNPKQWGAAPGSKTVAA